MLTGDDAVGVEDGNSAGIHIAVLTVLFDHAPDSTALGHIGGEEVRLGAALTEILEILAGFLG